MRSLRKHPVGSGEEALVQRAPIGPSGSRTGIQAVERDNERQPRVPRQVRGACPLPARAAPADRGARSKIGLKGNAAGFSVCCVTTIGRNSLLCVSWEWIQLPVRKRYGVMRCAMVVGVGFMAASLS